MALKITFINPNSNDEVDKYLPKILAEAMLNKIAKELEDTTGVSDNSYNVKHSA